jgi:hypothetical protein
LKKNKQAADAGVVEAAINEKLAITATVTFQIDLWLDMDTSQDDQ